MLSPLEAIGALVIQRDHTPQRRRFARFRRATIPAAPAGFAIWLLSCLAATFPAHAQPAASSRTITLVVPIAAGGGVDTIARVLAERLAARLKQPVVVENRVGAGGSVGADTVAKAAPDGHTLLMIESSAVLHKWLNKSTPFDVTRDFAPVALVATTPLLLFANPSLPVKNAKDTIAYARTTKLSVGTPGIGTPHHLTALMMNLAAGIDITHVPYRGTAPALNDLVGGQISLIWATPVAVMPMVAAGKVKVLGVASAQRLPSLPDVPTIAETLPGFNVEIWFGLAAPAHTPADIVNHLSTEVAAIMQEPAVQQRMKTLGFNLDYENPADFKRLIATDHARFGRVIQEAGMKPN